MGKQALASAQTRIHDAMHKATEDGYTEDQLRWFVTDKSLWKFQCCAVYYPFYRDFWITVNPSPLLLDPLVQGVMDGLIVVTDTNLKGHIAELRSISGDEYAITLDFSEAVNE